MFGCLYVEFVFNFWGFENEVLIKFMGFWEYDVCWWFGYFVFDKFLEFNFYGVQVLGLGFGILIYELGVELKIVVGYDFCSYFLFVK